MSFAARMGRQDVGKAITMSALILPLGVGLGYVLNVVLARSLTVEEFGIFSAALALAQVLCLLTSLGFGFSLMRLVPRYQAGGAAGTEQQLLVTSLAAVIIVSMLVALLLLLAANWFGSEPTVRGLVIAAMTLPLYAIDTWREGGTRGRGYLVQALAPRRLVLPAVMLVYLLFVPSQTLTSVVVVFVGLFVLVQMVCFRWLLPLGLIRPAQVTASVLRDVWPVSLPMAISSMARFGVRSWDIFLLGALSSMQDAGPYAAAARTALLCGIAVRIVNLAVGPEFAKRFQQGDRTGLARVFRISTMGAIVLGMPLYLLVMVFAEEILGLFGASYVAAAPVLRILATAELFNVLTGPSSSLLMMTDAEKQNLAVLVVAALASLLLLLLLIPQFDMLGAAWATASAIFMANLAHFSLAVRKLLQYGARQAPVNPVSE